MRTPDDLTVEVNRKAKGLARDLILHFYAALRVARFHSIDNAAAQQALDKLIATLDALFELHYDVSLLFYAKDFYVNDSRIKSSTENFKTFDELSTELKGRQIGGLSFNARPRRDALSHFIVVFNSVLPGKSESPYRELKQRLQGRGVQGIEVTKYSDGTVEALPVIDKRTFTKQSYFRAISVVEQLYEQARDRKPLQLKSAKRIVQNFVDLLEDADTTHSELLLLLTQVKNWRGYLFNHAVNTCVLSMILGHSIGLKRQLLRDLGICAVLADIGNATLPRNVLDAEEALTEAQWDQIRMHPITGVPAIASFQEMDRLLMRAVVACLTHHKRFDGGGYPAAAGGEGGLLGQIITVCDRYDAMTTARPYRPLPLTGPKALEQLANDAGDDLNPVIVRAFVQCMGALQAGTVVMLSTGEVGLVIRPQSSMAKGDVMKVRVLMQGSGTHAAHTEIEIGGARPVDVRKVVAAEDEALAGLKTRSILS